MKATDIHNFLPASLSWKYSSGVERVWLPGEKEIVTRQQRLVGGILLNAAMMSELRTLAAEAGVTFEL